MADMLSITALNARQGDALWIRWGDEAAPRQLLVDMGTEWVGNSLSERLRLLPVGGRAFELLVVTHVDRDHVGGVLTCLADPGAIAIPGLSFADTWFNGWPHLNGHVVAQPGAAAPTLEPMGPAQGERLASWLKGRPWNAAFGGGAVVRVPGQAPPRRVLPGDLEVTVLGPDRARLTELVPTWKDEVEAALEKGRLAEVSPGLEPMGPKTRPVLDDMTDLDLCAESRTDTDPSPTNGSSISLLLRYRGKSLLVTGDAFGADVVDGIRALSPVDPLAVDVCKLPHHGSQFNVTAGLVDAVDAGTWLFSSDGTQFRHPDPPAIARILRSGRTRPTRLAFNVPSTFSTWWDDDDWRTRFDYETTYGTKQDGLTLRIL